MGGTIPVFVRSDNTVEYRNVIVGKLYTLYRFYSFATGETGKTHT